VPVITHSADGVELDGEIVMIIPPELISSARPC
jgi:hypothetical protein